MVAAVVIAMIVMLVAAKPVGDFIHRHPTAKMLALSFLLLVGVALMADGLHFHIPRGYLYFAIAFSVLVEVLNLAASVRGWDFGDASTAERVSGLLRRNALELIVDEDALGTLVDAVTQSKRSLPVRWHVVPVSARGRIA